MLNFDIYKCSFMLLKSLKYLTIGSLLLVSCTKVDEPAEDTNQFTTFNYHLYSKVTSSSHNGQNGDADTIALDSNIVLLLWKNNQLVINNKDTFNYWQDNQYTSGRNVTQLSNQLDSITIIHTMGLNYSLTTTYFGMIQ